MLRKLLLTVLGCLLPSIVLAASHYIAVIDAGSTGSRMHVYAYEDFIISHLPALEEIYQLKIKPGLATYQANPEQAGTALIPLLDGAKAAIENAGGTLSQTHLILMGTGGMRQLIQAKQTAIYNVVRETFNQYPFADSDAVTIAGDKESVFDWIAVNYMSGHLHDPAPQTLGILDMGGASTEIAYSMWFGSPFIHYFMLGTRPFALFAYSFPGLGLNAALHFAPGFGDLGQCYPQGYPLGEDQKLGQYNETACRTLTNKQLGLYPITTIVPPINPQQHFMAFSAFPYVFDFFDAKNVSELNAALHKKCENYAWSALANSQPEVSESDASRACYNATLITGLLGSQFGYDLPDADETVTLSNQIEGQKISWALGAALYLLTGIGLETL